MSLVPCTWYWYCGQAPPVCVCIWDCIAICADICRNQLKAAPPLCFICPKQSPQMRRWTSTSSGFGFVKRVQGFKLVSKSTPSENGLSVYKSNSFYGIIGWYLFAFLPVLYQLCPFACNYKQGTRRSKFCTFLNIRNKYRWLQILLGRMVVIWCPKEEEADKIVQGLPTLIMGGSAALTSLLHHHHRPLPS